MSPFTILNQASSENSVHILWPAILFQWLSLSKFTGKFNCANGHDTKLVISSWYTVYSVDTVFEPLIYQSLPRVGTRRFTGKPEWLRPFILSMDWQFVDVENNMSRINVFLFWYFPPSRQSVIKVTGKQFNVSLILLLRHRDRTNCPVTHPRRILRFTFSSNI